MKKLTLEKITDIEENVYYTIFLNNIALWTSRIVCKYEGDFLNACINQAGEAKEIFMSYKEQLKKGLPSNEVLLSYEL